MKHLHIKLKEILSLELEEPVLLMLSSSVNNKFMLGCGTGSWFKGEIEEKAMAPYSSTLAWKIPWMEEPGRLQSMGSLRVRYDWVASVSLFTFHFHALEKEMAMHSSVLAWRIPGTGRPHGLLSMGLHRVGHDWSDLEAAAAAPVNKYLNKYIQTNTSALICTNCNRKLRRKIPILYKDIQ